MTQQTSFNGRKIRLNDFGYDNLDSATSGVAYTCTWQHTYCLFTCRVAAYRSKRYANMLMRRRQ